MDLRTHLSVLACCGIWPQPDPKLTRVITRRMPIVFMEGLCCSCVTHDVCLFGTAHKEKAVGATSISRDPGFGRIPLFPLQSHPSLLIKGTICLCFVAEYVVVRLLCKPMHLSFAKHFTCQAFHTWERRNRDHLQRLSHNLPPGERGDRELLQGVGRLLIAVRAWLTTP